MKIAVIGAGAMGSLMAARLTGGMREASTSSPDAPEISRVLLYGRPSPHLDAIRQHGLHLTERDGQISTIALETSSDPADVAGSDLVFIFVKAWATEDACAPLREYLTRDTIVITMQNGLGNAATLRSVLRKNGVRPHVWLAVTTQAAIRTAPGKISHTSDGVTALGRRVPRIDDELNMVAMMLRDHGWRCLAVSDIHRWVWRKLAINAAINPLTALAEVPNSAIAQDNDLRQAALSVLAEVVEVAEAHNIRLNYDQLAETLDAVAMHTGNPFSSMYDDLQRGVRTEIDAIAGQIVRHANRANIAAPQNTLLLRLLSGKERAAQRATSAGNARRRNRVPLA